MKDNNEILQLADKELELLYVSRLHDVDSSSKMVSLVGLPKDKNWLECRDIELLTEDLEQILGFMEEVFDNE